MIPLRWILVIAGLVLLAAIYFLGRRRHGNPSDKPALESASHRPAPRNFEFDGPRIDSLAAALDDDVPQLEQAVRIRARIEAPITVTREDVDHLSHSLDDLPPMHAGDANGEINVGLLAQPRVSAKLEPAIRDAHVREPSLGSFSVDTSSPTVQERGMPRMSAELPNDSNATATSILDAPMETPVRPPRKASNRKIVALRLAAASERVDGARLKLLLESAGLRHGKYSIYHRLHTDESPLFSIASMVEPGTFDPHAMSGIQFPGVTIFTQLPGPLPGEEMFAQMLACARELEQGIGGLLQDERGLPLTEQRAQRLRDDVADFSHLLGQS